MLRPKSVKAIATPPDRDTGKEYKYRFLFLLFPTTCFTSIVFTVISYYVGIGKNVFVNIYLFLLGSYRMNRKIICQLIDYQNNRSLQL